MIWAMVQQVKNLRVQLKFLSRQPTGSSQRQINKLLAQGWTLQQVVDNLSGVQQYIFVR
jgi:hypothetical protein